MNKLKVVNFKNLSELEIQPDGKSFTLSGKNGAGKTAVIDAVRWALQGNAFINNDVIKQGEDEVRVLYEDEQFSISRTMKRGKSPTIRVTDKQGSICQSPQSLLDTIVSNLSFDPADFLEMKPDIQMKSLRDLIDPEGNIAELEIEEKNLYDKRRDAGRDKDKAQKHFDSLPKPDASAGAEPKSRTDLMSEYESAQERKRYLDKLDSDITDLKLDIVELERKLKEANAKLESMESTRSKRPEPQWRTCGNSIRLSTYHTDIDKIKSELDSIDEFNEKVRGNILYQKARNELSDYESVHKGFEKDLAIIRAKIDKAIKSSDIPVEGMSFDTEGILLDGKRFSECSDGERLEAALKISMALNKGLRMIAIRNGSLMDDKRRKMVMDFAKAQGYQVIMEVVGSGDISVEIELEI